MEIPEISANQMGIMNEACIHMNGVFAQAGPVPEDDVDDRAGLSRTFHDVNHLLEIGLLYDISMPNLDKLDELVEKTKRPWRILEVTPVGKLMFKAYTSPLVN